MIHAKVIDGAISVYPYSFGNLRKDNPNVSFPKDFFEREDEFADFNVVKIIVSDKPSKKGWIPVEETPSFTDGKWSQNWNLVPKDASDVSRSEMEETEMPVKDGYRAEESMPELVDDVWHQKWILVEQTWLESRQAAYGRPEEQIEYITENSVKEWQEKVDLIKAKYPKS
tara:strand:+ start:708 stop:1217 length:510 start_codon:yes stop_codon:yes gene_type:complete